MLKIHIFWQIRIVKIQFVILIRYLTERLVQIQNVLTALVTDWITDVPHMTFLIFYISSPQFPFFFHDFLSYYARFVHDLILHDFFKFIFAISDLLLHNSFNFSHFVLVSPGNAIVCFAEILWFLHVLIFFIFSMFLWWRLN